MSSGVVSNLATFDPGPDSGPCTVCGAPATRLVREIVRPGENVWEFGCHEHAPGMHAAIADAQRERWRLDTYARVNGLSRHLTLSPGEYVGHYGHGWLVGGPPAIADDDAAAPPGLSDWSREVNRLRKGTAVAGNDESPLPDTEVHYLHSDHVGDDFKILVGHCDRSEPAPHILYLGDAAYNFGTAVEIVRLLTLNADIPPVLVVSVGYRAAALNSNEPLRSRDFTPSVDSSRPPPVPYVFG